MVAGSGGDTGSRSYLFTYGWGTTAYNYMGYGWIGQGVTHCSTYENVLWTNTGQDWGCHGGAFVYSSEAWQHHARAVSRGDIQDMGVRLYQMHALTVVDELSGPNVRVSACNFDPRYNHDSSLGACDHGENDGVEDAAASGCGISVVADSTGIHDGNFWTAAIVYAVWVDVQVNEVCVGTTGGTSVVFS